MNNLKSSLNIRLDKIGSRYIGLKQFDNFTLRNDIILNFSIHGIIHSLSSYWMQLQLKNTVKGKKIRAITFDHFWLTITYKIYAVLKKATHKTLKIQIIHPLNTLAI